MKDKKPNWGISKAKLKEGFDHYEAEMRKDGYIPNPKGPGVLPEYIKVKK